MDATAVDPVTRTLTGTFPAMVLLAALLSYPVARGLLRLYHRSVARSMQSASGTAKDEPPAAAAGGPPPATPLAIVDLSSPSASGNEAAYLLNAPARAAVVYAVAGATYAVFMTVGWLLANGIGISATRLVAIGWNYFWPTVLGVSLVASIARGHWRLVAGYFAVFLLLNAVAYAVSPNLRWFDMAVFWLFENGPPTVLLGAFLARRIRAVGPMVLAFMVLAFLGSQMLPILLEGRDEALNTVASAGFSLGLGGVGVFWGMLLLGALVFAVVGWGLLRWLGRRYEHKRFTDHMLTTDALWLLFGLMQSYTLAFQGWPWFFTGIVAFAAFRGARALGFRVLRSRPRPAARTLLLLRVFALGPRSASLFDVLQTHWLQQGNITLIAGPDLVTTTVEPHEFLAFLGGDLSRQFVEDRADLERRMAGMDTKPDVDGRYRVNEFFCHANTWQMVMRELAGRSDAVLMDLRSFSQTNRGCLYEIGELLGAVDLGRVVFVIDGSTDRKFFETSLAELWKEVPVQSPNRRGEAVARVFDLTARPTVGTWRTLLSVVG